MYTDTIAAIATALSESGIGIIRVSGNEAISICDRILRNQYGKKFLTQMKSHTIHYGYVLNQVDLENADISWKNHILDEVLVSFMKGPKSFTAEDVVEINCHGGVLMMQKILQMVLAAGARISEPGEFSKRAFLNGRIDLAEAEAVMDLISAKSEASIQSSIHQLSGSLSEKVTDLRARILYEIAFIESALDDPEHISLDGYPDSLSAKLHLIIDEVHTIISSFEHGKMIREGISTVILGKPNAGKSSLMNLLIGEDRAIVTEIAGTTRDTLEEFIHLKGMGLRLIDTAGIRDTDDVVEKIGVDRAKTAATMADLILYVMDASTLPDQEDLDILSLFDQKKAIILLNKSDLQTVCTKEDILTFFGKDQYIIPVLPFSAKTGDGYSELSSQIEKMFYAGQIDTNSEMVLTNMRHKEAFQNCMDSLLLVQQSIADGMEEDFYSIDLMNAYSQLGFIIGEEVEDDLVQEIFSKFCMGK